MKRTTTFLLFGVVFGFLLARAGVTDYDAIATMFMLTDLHLMGVIGSAIVVAAVGLEWNRRRAIGGFGNPTVEPKPMKPGLVLGAVLFGTGWALTGTCPGTGLAQIGEGKWIALFTVAGILAGSALYRVFGARVEGWISARSSRPRPV